MTFTGLGRGTSTTILWSGQGQVSTPRAATSVNLGCTQCLPKARLQENFLPPLPARRALSTLAGYESLEIESADHEVASTIQAACQARDDVKHDEYSAADDSQEYQCYGTHLEMQELHTLFRPFAPPPPSKTSHRKRSGGLLTRLYCTSPQNVSNSAYHMPSAPSRPAAHHPRNVFGNPSLDRCEVKDPSFVVRTHVDQALAQDKELNILRARRRRWTAKSIGEEQRRQARQRCQRQSSEQSVSQVDGHDLSGSYPAEVLQPARARKGRASMTQMLSHMMYVLAAQMPSSQLQPGAEDLSEDTASVEHQPTTDSLESEGSQNAQTRGSILGKLTLKTSRRNRLRSISSYCKEVRQQERLQRLVEIRWREFYSRPEHEKEELQQAFSKYGTNQNENGDVDIEDVMESLADLGLEPTTDVEKKELERVCQEVALLGDMDFFNFVFELVPQVRERLRELRRSSLVQQFTMYDQDRNGFLDQQECKEIFERICMGNLDPDGLAEMQAAFAETFADLANDDDQLDFDGFEALVERTREHYQRIVGIRIADICRKEALEALEKQSHKDELVLLYDSFKAADSDHDGLMEFDQLSTPLFEYNLRQIDPESIDKLSALFDKTDLNGDDRINFKQFLRLIRRLRKDKLELQEPHLRQTFARFDKDSSGTLDAGEIGLLLTDLGIEMNCRDDQMETRQLMKEMDKDGSGDFDFEEFTVLVQEVQERLNRAARRRQRLIARAVGFDELRFRALMGAFASLDMKDTGIVTFEQLQAFISYQARTSLGIELQSLTQEETNMLLEETAGEIGHVDFEGFIRLFGSIAPNNGTKASTPSEDED